MRWAFPLFLIVVAVLGFVLITQPIYDEATVLKQEADKYNEALANSRVLQQERDRLTNKFNSFNQDDLTRIKKIVPDSVDNIRLILEIQQVAQERGILVQNVKFEPNQFVENPEGTTTGSTSNTNLRRPSTASENLPYDIFDLEFSIEGKYGAFVEFMKLMEKSLRVVDVRTIAFTPGTSESRESQYNDNYKYTFRINTYRLKDI